MSEKKMDTFSVERKDNKIIFTFVELKSDTEKIIRDAIKEIVERYGQGKNFMSIFSCIKELIINATKGNYKKIFFDAYVIENELDDIASYEKWLDLFRLEIEEHGKENFARIAKQEGLVVELHIEDNDGNIEIEVINNVPLSSIEKQRIEDRLKKGYEAADMFELINESDDDSHREGAGLGLAMIMFLLKNLGGTKEDINIYTDKFGKTHAKIKFNLKKS